MPAAADRERPWPFPDEPFLPDSGRAQQLGDGELTGSALDRVSVRVIAKIRQSTTYAGGKANSSATQGTWAIRNISHAFRAAPLNDNSEMVLIRSEDPEFVFAPGRYALAFKGQGYDFSVVGPVMQAAQCLDRVEADNGVFYSECRNP